MTAKIVVFAGPSLVQSDMDDFSDCLFLPPAAKGDILRSLTRDAPDFIGLIDGYFDDRAAVQHKELLEVMAMGIKVYGAASMGALRASELHTFGMIGVGEIFKDYHDGTLTSDADVAVQHGPSDLGFPALTIPQVDVKATVTSLTGRGHLTRAEGQRLLRISQDMFYKRRSWARIAEAVGGQPDSQDRLAKMLAKAHVQAKRLDALALMHRITQDAKSDHVQPTTPFVPPRSPNYQELRRSILEA